MENGGMRLWITKWTFKFQLHYVKRKVMNARGLMGQWDLDDETIA